MVVDISFLTYLAPIFAFLIVFVVSFAVLVKTEIIGDDKWVGLIVSLVIASLFVSMAGAKQYVINVIPWLAVLLVCFFFILFSIGIIGKNESMNKGLAIVFLILAGIVFLVVGFIVFSSYINPYLPTSYEYGTGNPVLGEFFAWLYSSRVTGAILLIIISIVVSWILMKGVGKK